jgi:hypothetical protein
VNTENGTRTSDLLDRLRDGALTEEERAELERTLLSSPTARAEFWDHARFHGLLERWGQEEWGRRMAEGRADTADPADGRPARTFRGRARLAAGALAAAAALAAGLAVAFLWTPNRPTDPATPAGPVGPAEPHATAEQPTDDGPGPAAMLVSAVGAEWAGDAGERPAPGAVLMPDARLRLSAGVAQVEFCGGARVIVQGPADVRLVSPHEVHCSRGRLTAHVPPPARGFRAAAPGLSLTDLGTEFGLSVPDAGPAEVHVFTGSVDAEPETPPGQRRPAVRLTAGRAVRAGDDGLRPIAADRAAFVGEPEFAALASGDRQRRREVWRTAAAALDRDPAALAHFALDDEDARDRTVPDRVAAAKGDSAGAAGSAGIVGCGRVEGRFPGSRAVEFRGPGDRLRLDIPARPRALTLLAWVRVDALPNAHQALLAPDATAEGTVRWGVSNRGELRLAIARRLGRPEFDWEVVISPPVVTPERLGRWMMLAVTFDGRSVRHYVDGEPVKTGQSFDPGSLSIGPADAGNGRSATPRFLRGRMDELAVLGRAMTPQEIRNLYDAGRPDAPGPR